MGRPSGRPFFGGMMPVESAGDRAAYLDIDEFGVAATYNGATTVNGIFDSDYFEITGGEVGIESSQPVFFCQTSDVSSAKHGDTLLVNSVTYKIIGVKDDGIGMTMLILEEQ